MGPQVQLDKGLLKAIEYFDHMLGLDRAPFKTSETTRIAAE